MHLAQHQEIGTTATWQPWIIFPILLLLCWDEHCCSFSHSPCSLSAKEGSLLGLDHSLSVSEKGVPASVGVRV